MYWSSQQSCIQLKEFNVLTFNSSSMQYFRKELDLKVWISFEYIHTFNLLCTSILLHDLQSSLHLVLGPPQLWKCKDKKSCHWPNLLDLSQTDSLNLCPVLAAASYLRTLVTSRTWSLRCPGLAEDRGPRSSLQNLVLKSQFNETHLGHSVMKNNWRYGEFGSMLASFHDLKTLTIRNWQSLEKIEENAFAGLFLCLFYLWYWLHLESIFENFVISKKMSMVDEVTIIQIGSSFSL